MISTITAYSKLIWILLIFLIPSCESDERCTFCSDGNPVPNPDFVGGDLIGIPGSTCGEGDIFLQTVPADDPICDTFRSASSLCGCEIPEDACYLCSDGSRVPDDKKKQLLLPEVNALLLIPGIPAIISTCDFLEAVLFGNAILNSQKCLKYQREYFEQCGCPIPPTMPIVNASDETSFTAGVVTTTEIFSAAPSFKSCSICSNGGKMMYPERLFERGIEWEHFDIDLYGLAVLLDAPGLTLTCDNLDIYANNIPEEDKVCRQFKLLSSYCGCEYENEIDSQCSLCSNGKAASDPRRIVDWGEEVYRIFGLPPIQIDCGMLENIFRNYKENSVVNVSDNFCTYSQVKSYYCGCDFDWKLLVSVWIFRVSALLSLIGSILIIWSICQGGKEKLKNTYHQILLGISSFDTISSLMYLLGTLMTPKKERMYQAIGNMTTCKVQGFFIQFGLTSAFFNALLSLYYYLIVCHNWTEFTFKKYRIYAYIIIVLTGMALSISGLWYYDSDHFYCYVQAPPSEKSILPIMIHNIVPIVLVFLICILSTTMLVWKVYKQHRKGQRWRMTKNNGKTSLFDRVLSQSIYFVASFVFTLPILLVKNFVHLEFNSSMATSVELFFTWRIIVAFFGPVQGFLNAIVYFKRKGVGCCELFGCDRKHDKVQKEARSSSRTTVLTYNNGTTVESLRTLDNRESSKNYAQSEVNNPDNIKMTHNYNGDDDDYNNTYNNDDDDTSYNDDDDDDDKSYNDNEEESEQDSDSEDFQWSSDDSFAGNDTLGESNVPVMDHDNSNDDNLMGSEGDGLEATREYLEMTEDDGKLRLSFGSSLSRRNIFNIFSTKNMG